MGGARPQSIRCSFLRTALKFLFSYERSKRREGKSRQSLGRLQGYCQHLAGQFCHELISRATPGFILLGLYAHEFVLKTYHVFHSSSILFGVGIILLGWLIGVVLDLIVFIPLFIIFGAARLVWVFLLFHLHPLADSAIKWVNQFTKIESENDETPDPYPELIRRVGVGIKVMFRSLALICIIVAFISPHTNLCAMNNWDIEHPRFCAFFAGVVFFGLWAFTYLSQIIENNHWRSNPDSWSNWSI